MTNITGQIEIKKVTAPGNGADRTRREAGENRDSTFSSFFTQYLEAGDANRDKLKPSKQNQEHAAEKKEVKPDGKLLTAEKPPDGKKGQQARLSKNRRTGRPSRALPADKTSQNGKKGRFIQLTAGNRSSVGLLKKRIQSLNAKKQYSLSSLDKKSAGSNSTVKMAVVLAKKYIAVKNRTDSKEILKAGKAEKGGEAAKNDTAITGSGKAASGKAGRKINSIIKKTGSASIKDRNNGSLFKGADDKNNVVIKTGELDKVLGKKTAAGELSSACIKYDNNVPKTAVKPDYQIHRNADEIFNDIVKRFSLVVKKGGGEARIVLQPEVLGQLKMKMSLNKNVINTFMVVDNEAVKDLILGKLNILEQNLQQQGFNLGSFQVDVKDKNTEFGTSGDEVNKGHRAENLDEEEIVLELEKGPGVPWISTIVNLTA